MESNVSLFDGESKVQTHGNMTLSTHRILYQLDKYRVAFPLEAVTDIQEKCPWAGKSKLVLYFAPDKYIMLSLASGFKAIRKAVMDAVDSRRNALMKTPASHTAAVARPQIIAGIGTVLEMQVFGHSSLGPTAARRRTPAPYDPLLPPPSAQQFHRAATPTSLPAALRPQIDSLRDPPHPHPAPSLPPSRRPHSTISPPPLPICWPDHTIPPSTRPLAQSPHQPTPICTPSPRQPPNYPPPPT